MTEQRIEIERIVREVIAEMQWAVGSGQSGVVSGEWRVGSGDRKAESGKRKAESDETTPPDCVRGGTSEDTLILSCRVVTLSEVTGKLESIRRLIVPPKAVVTPAVRDELYRQDVSLEFASPADDRPSGSPRLVLVTAGRHLDATALIAAVGREGIAAQPHASDCLIGATDLLADEVIRPGTLGLLLTRHPAAAVCLANRHRSVRAASATDVATVAAAVESVGANVLVIDPNHTGPVRQKQIVAEFCRGGIRDCPKVFQERLT